MATSRTSTPWHAIFAFLIPAIGMIVQMHFHNSSPLEEHPANIWVFIKCSLLYCFALGYNIKCQIYTPTDTTFLDRSIKVAFISGSLAYAALISVLVPRSLQPLVFVIWLMLIFVYFYNKKIVEIGENIASYLGDLWITTKSKAATFYEQWWRTESGNVPPISRPPV